VAAPAARPRAEGLRAARAVLTAPRPALPRYARQFARGVGLPPRSTSGLVARLDGALGGRESSDPLRLAPSQRARTLVLHDPADREVPLADAQALARAWPGARLELLEGAGHTGALRHPDVISRAVGFVTDPALALSA